jgi:glutamate-ammonia-ligase adenylyltransferase
LGKAKVVSLLGLSGYTPEQLEQARTWSPIFRHYEALLNATPADDIHGIRLDGWLRSVLATYFHTASTEAICASWSDVADKLLRLTWERCGLESFAATLISLGKHGARELNLSSDIDLIVVAEPRDAFGVEKAMRKFQQTLQTPGISGFCFRLDFDLRPGGKMGPLITTPSQFQDHYWSQGETWERLALVRARAVAGTDTLARQILLDAHKFSYRKFLDFTLLDDLKALRSQVHQKGFDRRDGEIHLKLEVGGIRDIELFTHSLLIMNGGKLPELQTQSTTAALLKLAERKILPQAECDELLNNYWHYRHMENWIQSLGDRQTHSLTAEHQRFPELADTKDTVERMQRVDKIVSSLLGQVDLSTVHLPTEEADQVAWLGALGFSQTAIQNTWQPLMASTALSHKNDRDERARKQFLFTFVQELARHRGLDRDLGLSLLLDFVKATRAKATFFTMLLSSPRLIQDLARLFCLSPYLGSIISSRPELLDHFILQVDEGWASDLEQMLQQMAERKLLTELWSANQFLIDRDLPTLCSRVTETADAIALHLVKTLKTEFPKSGLEIVAMGKWAGRELGLRSDLDFVFVSENPPNEDDVKVARRFISRLSDPARGGSLFDIDLRLRPSGQSGPLLVTLPKLIEYWRGPAKIWERQAYLRAKPFATGIKFDKSILVERALTEEDRNELREIRLKLLKKPTEDSVDIKYAPGGLLDVEFVTQTAILSEQIVIEGSGTEYMMSCLAEKSQSWQTHLNELKTLYRKLRTFEQMLHLSSAHKIGMVKPDTPAFIKASGLMGFSREEGWKEMRSTLDRSRAVLNELDPTGIWI